MKNPISYLKNRYQQHKDIQRLAMLIKTKGIGALKDDSILWKSMRVLMNNADGVTQPYSQCVWIYASVSAISKNISRVPLNIVTKPQESKNIQPVTDGEIYELFQNPNPMMTLKEIVEATEVFMGLNGEAFWVIDRESIDKVPKEIWCLDPERFTPVLLKGNLVGWNLALNNVKKTFLPLHSVIHFKMFNPYDMVRGLAPYQAVSMAVDQNYYADSYNTQFFKDGATVGGFITFKEEIGQEAYDRLLAQFTDRHKGHSNAHKIGILEGGGDFREAKLSQKDMDFIKQKKLSREEIFGAYKTNPVILGLYEDVKSYEGQKIAQKTFWNETLIPAGTYLVEQMWSRFFSKIDGGKVWATFDYTNVEALQESFDEKTTTALKLFTMGVPLNAINRRLEMGLEEQPHGDIGFIPSTFIPASVAGNPSGEVSSPSSGGSAKGAGTVYHGIQNQLGYVPQRNIKLPPAIKQVLIESEATKTIADMIEGRNLIEEMIKAVPDSKAIEVFPENQVPVIKEKDEAWEIFALGFWENYLKVQLPLEKQTISKLKRFFFEQRKYILSKLHSEKTANEFIEKASQEELFLKSIMYNVNEEITKATGLLKEVYEKGTEQGAIMVAEELGVTGFLYEPLEEVFLKPMMMRLTNIPPEIVNTITDQLRKSLIEGITSGETITELANRVKEVYNFAQTRIMTIARTESGTAISNGRYQLMRNEGVEKHKWITARDSAVRHSHQALDREVAKIGDKFGSTTLKTPNDPDAPPQETINCRCITQPIVEDKK